MLTTHHIRRGLTGAINFWNADRNLTVLLVLLAVLLFVVTPLAQVTGIGVWLNGVVFTLLAITATAAVTHRSAIVATVSAFGLARLLLDEFMRNPMSASLVVGDLALRAAFVLLIAVLMLVHVLRPGHFSHHRVQGAIAIYLLAALAWAYAYEVLHLVDPAALHISALAGASPNLALFRFFSFETLTALGYGDVLPVGSVARSLVASEAVFGQLFPAIMITRLVSLEFAERTSRRRD